MPVDLGKQKGKRARGKKEKRRKNVGCLKDPVEENVILPVVIGVDEAGNDTLLCP